MQRAAVLIVPSKLSVDQLELRIKAIPGVTLSRNDAGTELDVRFEADPSFYVFVSPAPNRALAIEDYADNDELDSTFRSTLEKCKFFVLLGNSLELLRAVTREALEYAMGLGDSWFDDDQGHVLRAQAVLSRLRTEPDWDLIDA
jgi:hypothetical protein